MLARALSGSGGGSGKEGFLLTFDKGNTYQTNSYRDTNYSDYASDAVGSGYSRVYTFKKKVKGIVTNGPYSTGITGTADLTQLFSDSDYKGYVFEADVNETVIATNTGWNSGMCQIVLTDY